MLTSTDKVNDISWIDRLVTSLKDAGVIHSPAMEAAFRRIPRHRLISDAYFKLTSNGWSRVEYEMSNPRPEDLDFIYSNESVVTDIEEGIPSSSTSAPGLVAVMLDLLRLEKGMKVLEIGAGTGYNSALISELVGDQSLVVTVDIQEKVIARTSRLLGDIGYSNIKLLTRDGFVGAIEDAPYDRIIATVGCSDISPHWIAQLKPSGFILAPLMHGGWYPLVKIWPGNGHLEGKFVGQSGFMLIQGELRMTGIWPFTHVLQIPLDGFQELPAFDNVNISSLKGFFDFIIFRDHRAISLNEPPAHGLYDKDSGIVLIRSETGSVLFNGNQELYNELYKLYEEWQKLGKPQRSDCILEFMPITNKGTDIYDSTLSLERKFYRQIVRFPQNTIIDPRN